MVYETRTPQMWQSLKSRKEELRQKLAADIRLTEQPYSDGWAFSGKKGSEFEGLGILWMNEDVLKEVEIVIQCSYEERGSAKIQALTKLLESLIGESAMREIKVTVNSSPFA